jgi:hypothetical protein
MTALAGNHKVANASEPIRKSTAKRFPRIVGTLFQNGNHRFILKHLCLLDISKRQLAAKSIMHE